MLSAGTHAVTPFSLYNTSCDNLGTQKNGYFCIILTKFDRLSLGNAVFYWLMKVHGLNS